MMFILVFWFYSFETQDIQSLVDITLSFYNFVM